MSIINAIKRMFSKKKDQDMSEQTTTSDQSISEKKTPLKRKHKLEIQVYEADYDKADANNGQPQWRPVNYGMDNGKPLIIEVANKKEFDELKKQYAMCDQRIKVIREIDPFVDEEQQKTMAAIPQNNQAIPVAPQVVSQPPIAQSIQPIAQDSTILQPAVKPKPKIVMIGDIEVKYDGDKVYQKQWMKLTPAEASNFRVVADSSNKIVNLNGKHIEAKRWTLIEEKSMSQDDDSVDNLIEG